MALVQSQQFTGGGMSGIAHAAVVFARKLWEQAPYQLARKNARAHESSPMRSVRAES